MRRSYIQRKPYQWKRSPMKRGRSMQKTVSSFSTFRERPKRAKKLKASRSRLRARRDPQMVAWSGAVLERDEHHCRWPECNERGPQVIAHHIQTRRQRPDLKYQTENGAAICTRHHDLLHHTLNGRRRARDLGLLGGTTYEKAQKEREAA